MSPKHLGRAVANDGGGLCQVWIYPGPKWLSPTSHCSHVREVPVPPTANWYPYLVPVTCDSWTPTCFSSSTITSAVSKQLFLLLPASASTVTK